MSAAVAVSARNASVSDRIVAFTVVNRNESQVPCATDGLQYVIRGHLVAPVAAIQKPDRSVTLYLHGGLTSGDFAWRFPGFGGRYDFAARMADLGHASVVIDRLGWGKSGIPNGLLECVGSQADIAHQIVLQLRRGTYRVIPGHPVAFRRVALAGHSGGGVMAGVEAYSFRDIDALAILMSAFDQGLPPELVPGAAKFGSVCARGGEGKYSGAPAGGYSFIFRDELQFFFNGVDPAVVHAAQNRLERDVCGEGGSVPTALGIDRYRLGAITVPVLLLFGAQDRVFPPSTAMGQRQLFSAARDIRVRVVQGVGHAFQVSPRVGAARAEISKWLAAHAF